ncbi:MAG: hypothetical protein KHW93_06470 [Butyricicoccus pullicaecorum]|nr:hypothetical protein [Butyricicoccus pullicaecorum]
MQVAGIALGVESRYDYLPWLCRGYGTSTPLEAWFSATADEVAAMHAL